MAGFTPISWPTASQVTLAKVAWDSSYRDVVRFASPEAREAYFASKATESVTIDHTTYLKPNEPIMINTPYSKAYTYNYCVVKNPQLPVPGEVTPPVLFYFITSVAYVAPNTTALTVELDCWQTYCFDVCFGNCFVERGHVAIQAERNTTGADYQQLTPRTAQRYLTAAEGLDVGNEYLVAQMEHFDLSNVRHGKNGGFRVIIMSTTDLAADWGTKDNPHLKTADGQKTDGLIGGCNVYALSTLNFENFMGRIAEAPWVAKGIISISAFPSTLLTDGPEVSLNGTPAHFLGETPDQGIYWTSRNVWWCLGNGIPDRYKGLRKFFTWPYSVIELNAFNGSSVLLKPELLLQNTIALKNIACAAPPHMKVGFYPEGYGEAQTNGTLGPVQYSYYTMDIEAAPKTNGIIPSFYTDVAVWFQNMPQFSLVNDGFLSYMASTAHTREYQYNAAGWGQEKSIAGTELSFDQAKASLANNQANQDISNIATVAHAGVNGISSLLSGNVGGAIQGTIGTGIDLVAGNMQFQNNQALQSGFATQNAELAKWAARGDYQTQIAGINATVQDAALTQPSTVGQAGGDGFNLANGLFGVSIRYRTCDANHVRIIGEYWLRYGYAVRQFMTPPKDLQCMSNFTYWKMAETYLTCASADEGAKDVIRGIFEKGVTVWANPDNIGRIDIANNAPLPGVPY